MNTISRRELSKLAEVQGDPLISIYMPTYTGAEHRQNPLRFKNLLRSAEEKLLARGLPSREVKALLDPGRELLERSAVWNQQGPALAAFIGPDGVVTWRLPIECGESCSVESCYHLVPLVMWHNNDAPYYVLAVSQNEVRLWRGTRAEIEPLNVPELPANKAEAIRFDGAEPGLQAHSTYSSREGMMVHGHGGAPDAHKDLLEEFMRALNRPLGDFLRLETAPLIFAGVDYLFPIFRQFNRYPHLAAQPITGNAEIWSAGDLRQRAWPMVESMLRERRDAALDRYGDSISVGRASSQMEEILVAAHVGAVDLLFIDPSARCTGAYDAGQSRVTIDPEPREGGEDLINLATVLTLRNKGTVEPLAPGKVPGGGPVAAMLRYPLTEVTQITEAAAQR